jgi:hypothetical protein
LSGLATLVFAAAAGVIGLSVACKLAIYLRLVPAVPENGLHETVHGLARIAGIFRRSAAMPARRPRGRAERRP